MTGDRFEMQLQEILARIAALPEQHRAHLMKVVEETRERHQYVRESVARARSALDDWRIMQKYRVFDLEASLREQRSGRQRPPDDVHP